jgi:hypothetical protein
MGMSRAREQRGLTGKVGSDLGRLVHARATAGPYLLRYPRYEVTKLSR